MGQENKAVGCFGLVHLQVSCGGISPSTATVQLQQNGKVLRADAGIGNGPVDAVIKTINRITGVDGWLYTFSVHPISSGGDAIGEVAISVSFAGLIEKATAAETDIVLAVAEAYLKCVNKFLSHKK